MNKIFDYKNLTLNELIEKISTARFFHLPKMVAEALRKLTGRIETLENTPTGDYIPLSGTTVGNPVTGDIDLSDFNRIKVNSTNSNVLSYIEFDDGSFNFKRENYLTGFNSNFRLIENGIIISDDNPANAGLSGAHDYSANITDLDYTQKIYIDERGSVVNTTTSVLDASTLNSTYPNAKDGFSVIAPNVVGGGKYYIKAGAGWVYQQILAVV